MKTEEEREAHRRFVQALQHEHLICAKPGCGGAMDIADHTLHSARIKTYEAICERCGAVEKIAGHEQSSPPMIENVIGLYSLPIGIALNFQVNGKDVLVPMTLEEPSVVAGASFMAKLARAGGGFQATTTEPHMIGQMQILDLPNVHLAQLSILEHKEELLAEADAVDPVLKKFGGGARNLEVRVITESPIGPFLVVHLIYDVRDAMGANAVNTAANGSLLILNPLLADVSTCVFSPILQHKG